jgi:hypothetical protein
MSEGPGGEATIEQFDDIAVSFIGWQCRLRQHVVRRGDGRPSAGMCPEIVLADGRRLGTIVTVLVKRDPKQEIAQFQQIVKRTYDPLERYEAAIGMLQTVYYQYPREFSDALTALFNRSAPTAQTLIAVARCTMDYRQANQRFLIPCAVEMLPPEAPFYQATYWHNAMFNPKLNGPVSVLKFVPDWSAALAEIG